jgi:hypothetical protein
MAAPNQESRRLDWRTQSLLAKLILAPEGLEATLHRPRWLQPSHLPKLWAQQVLERPAASGMIWMPTMALPDSAPELPLSRPQAPYPFAPMFQLADSRPGSLPENF